MAFWFLRICTFLMCFVIIREALYDCGRNPKMSSSQYKNIKRTQWTALILQIIVVISYFIPIATIQDNRRPVNSVQLGMLYIQDGRLLSILGGCLYCALLFVLPLAIWLITLWRKPRLNYGICALLCALEVISSSCFYTMALHRMSNILILKPSHYIIVFLELLNMFVFALAYLQAWNGNN